MGDNELKIISLPDESTKHSSLKKHEIAFVTQGVPKYEQVWKRLDRL